MSPSNAPIGTPVTLTATAVGSSTATTGIEAKWDDLYDGTWDTAFAANAPRTVTLAAARALQSAAAQRGRACRRSGGVGGDRAALAVTVALIRL